MFRIQQNGALSPSLQQASSGTVATPQELHTPGPASSGAVAREGSQQFLAKVGTVATRARQLSVDSNETTSLSPSSHKERRLNSSTDSEEGTEMQGFDANTAARYWEAKLRDSKVKDNESKAKFQQAMATVERCSVLIGRCQKEFEGDRGVPQ